MGNLIDYAKSELDRAFPDETDELQLEANKDILELINAFSKQGHSNFSGHYVLQYFNRLVNFLPIGPLTGEDDEWDEPSGRDNLQQNKRCFKVFRTNFDNSTAYNMEGRVFIDDEGTSYTCNKSKVMITFPYEVPDKPEYIRRNQNLGNAEE